MYLTVDRLENDMVVLEQENGDTVAVSRDSLPAVKQGDVLVYCDGTYTVDEQETEKRRQTVFDLEQKLRNKFSR